MASEMFWTTYFLLIALPLHGSNRLMSDLTVYANLTVFHGFLACILLHSFVRKGRAAFRFRMDAVGWIYLLYFGLLAGSVLNGFLKGNSLRDVTTDIAPFALQILLFLCLQLDEVKRKSPVELIVLTSKALAVNCVFNLVMYATKDWALWGLESFNEGRYGGNYYTLLIVAVPFAFFSLYNRRNYLKPGVVAVLVAAGALGSLLLTSRTHVAFALAGCLAVCLTGFWERDANLRRAKIMINLAMGILLAGLVVATQTSDLALFERFRMTNLLGSSDTGSSRIAIAGHYLPILLNHPEGLGFGTIMPTVDPIVGVVHNNPLRYYVDNALITMSYKAGIIATTLYLMILLTPLIMFRKAFRLDKAMKYSLYTFYALLLIASVVLTSQSIHAVAVSAFLAALCGLDRKDARCDPRFEIEAARDAAGKSQDGRSARERTPTTFFRRCVRHAGWVYENVRHRWLLKASIVRISRKKLRCGLNPKPREPKVVVSMTSYPGRFPTLHIVLRRMLDQTVKPDKLILYLDDSVDPQRVPETIRALEPFGLEIRFRPHDLKPHKKYLFAMLEHPDDIIITVDDDMIYPRNLIETLMASYFRHPDCISAIRAHRITFDENGMIKPYSQWEWAYRETDRPSLSYFATGVGGVLYPPRCVPESAFDIPMIRRLSPNNDDIWLKFMQIQSGTRVVICGRDVLRKTHLIDDMQSTALNADNVHGGANDQQIAAMMAHMRFTRSDFIP